MRKISKKTTTIFAIILISLIIIIYYIFFYNSTTYKEFEKTQNIKELIPYEETQEDVVSYDNKTKDEIIIIHIAGAVKNWGIIELPINSRISDAIEKAGGLTDDADISQVNLAYILEDGMKLTIPNVDDKNKEYFQEKEYITTDNGENIVEPMNNNTREK